MFASWTFFDETADCHCLLVLNLSVSLQLNACSLLQALPREASAVSMASDARTEAYALVASSPKQGKRTRRHVRGQEPAREMHLCNARHLFTSR